MQAQPREILWQPSPRQADFLAAGEEELLYGGAAGGGKLLRLDEPIPTPAGWTTMGALYPGAQVFDETGKPCRVVAVFAVETPAEAFRLEFDDGSVIEAGGEHRWLTFDAKEMAALTRKSPEWRSKRRESRPSRRGGLKSARFSAVIAARNSASAKGDEAPTGTIRTTGEIASSVKTSARSNCAIPVTGPLLCAARDLPLDAYVLGVWLGDGSSAASVVTMMAADWGVVGREFAAAGWRNHGITSSGKTWSVPGLVTRLREIGVFRNKHVPADYLRGSLEQRLALLQGLMDTDGTVTAGGAAEFCTTSEALAHGAQELIASLGWKARMRRGDAKLYGRVIGPKWTLKWTPDRVVFRLPRKVDRQRLATRRTCRFRYVVSAERCNPVPMRCIAVDSPSRLYLAGRAMIPTHNSDALVIDALGLEQGAVELKDYRAILFRRTYPELRDLIDRAQEIYGQNCPGAKYNSQEHIYTWPSGAKVEFGHMNHPNDRFKYRGRQFAYEGWDELTLYPDDVCYRYLFSRLRSPQTRLKCYVRSTTNPDGPGHKWVKERWAIPNEGTDTCFRVEIPDEVTGKVYTRWRRFIRATLDDNPYLTETEYRIELLQLPPDEREALLRGRWDGIPVKGAYWAEFIKAMRREGRICRVPHYPGVPVDTYWDLGYGDSTTIVFHQSVALQDRIIAAYENSGEALAHYAGYLKDRGYIYGTHYLPHDAEPPRMGQTEASTKSWKDMLSDLLPGHTFEIVPRIQDVTLGIDQTRLLFPGLWVDETECADAISAWENYRKEWDEKLQVYRTTPLHDWSSHYADALRQMGQKRANLQSDHDYGGYTRPKRRAGQARNALNV